MVRPTLWSGRLTAQGTVGKAMSPTDEGVLLRIEREAGVPNLVTILADRLAPTDLQSLLLAVYRRSAQRRSPTGLVSEYRANRFTRPSEVDPRLMQEFEALALANLPKGFDPVELSPLGPLGTSSVLTPVSQDWSVSTARNTEVSADSTTLLALECAVRRQRNLRTQGTGTVPVHLATSQRVVRAQRYRDAAARSHFRLFSLCSAGRDARGHPFEREALKLHLGFYLRAVRAFLGPDVRLRATLSVSREAARVPEVQSWLGEAVPSGLSGLELHTESKPEDLGDYYRGFRFHVSAQRADESWADLVDGGPTDWTRKLLSNEKERLLTSGIGSERLCTLLRSPS
jgi:hypothetical protein